MESGTIYKEELENGKKYEVYVPENVNEDTPILVYTLGAALPDSSKNQEWQDIQQALIDNNSDVIVIFPNHQSDCNDYFWTYPQVANEMVDAVKETYGTNTTNIMNAGWSSASSYAVRATIHHIENNPDIERQTIFLHDGFIYGNNLLSKDEIKILEQNDTIIVSYAQEHNWHQISMDLVNSDLDILYITDDPPKTLGYWGYHSEITTGFFKNNMFDILVDCIYGGKPMSGEGYKFQVYNKETKKLEVINVEDIPTLFGLDIYKATISKLSSDTFMQVKSNNKYLEDKLNGILKVIKDSSFIKNNYNEKSTFESTTQVPSQLSKVISDFFDSNASLLMKLTNDIHSISKIAETYEEIDNKMKEEAESIIEPVLEVAPIVVIDDIVNNINTSISNIQINNEVVNLNDNLISQEETINETKDETIENDDTVNNKDSSEVKNIINTNNLNNNKNNNIQNHHNASNQNNINNNHTNNIDFPKYEEIYSDDKKIVYNCDDKYKIIIYKDGDRITGIEHYYDFGTKDAASSVIGELKNDYFKQEHFDKLIQSDRYIKVTFDENMFKDLTLYNIKERYSTLQEVVRK